MFALHSGWTGPPETARKRNRAHAGPIHVCVAFSVEWLTGNRSQTKCDHPGPCSGCIPGGPPHRECNANVNGFEDWGCRSSEVADDDVGHGDNGIDDGSRRVVTQVAKRPARMAGVRPPSSAITLRATTADEQRTMKLPRSIRDLAPRSTADDLPRRVHPGGRSKLRRRGASPVVLTPSDSSAHRSEHSQNGDHDGENDSEKEQDAPDSVAKVSR